MAAPKDPFSTTYRPGTVRKASETFLMPRACSSSPSNTVMDEARAPADTGTLVAVTVTSLRRIVS